MKMLLLTLALLTSASAYSQGTFLSNNIFARTRLVTDDGPFAGVSIWGQWLVGTNSESLTPIGPALQHGNGYVNGGTLTVPGSGGGTTVYLQLAAWNNDLWGMSFATVPPDQIGRTDVIPYVLSYSFQPTFAPQFTRSAIVPIPEPSTWALSALGAAGFWFVRRRRR